MKKVIFLGIVAAMTVTMSVTAFAFNKTEMQSHHKGVCVESSTQGTGACTYGNCKCTQFDQRPGYYQCWCGHQSFVHK